jgi:hypothetical protein
MINIELLVTLAFFLGGGALIGYMAVLEKRPKTKLEPRLVPTTLIMLLGALIMLMAFFHLYDLLKPVVHH